MAGQIVLRGLRPPQPKLFVVGFAAARIGMPNQRYRVSL